MHPHAHPGPNDNPPIASAIDRPILSIRLLTSALLLATLILPTWPRLATGQEIKTSAVTATNATEWVIPPEVEALFPNDAEFKDGLWYILTHPRQLSTEKFKIRFVRGTYQGVCHDYETNVNLWGGKYELGASWSPIHPNHPHKDRFRAVEWEKLDARKHINIIRDIYVREWRRTNTERSQDDPNYMWKEMAPIIKRILFGQNNGVYFYLERATLDIANSGERRTVYRYAFYPIRSRLNIGGETVPSWSYYFEDNSDFIKGYDVCLKAHEFFYYMDKLYFTNEVGMEIQSGFKRNGKIGISTRCEFDKLN